MEEKLMLLNMINNYARTGSMQDGDIKIIRVQDRRTTFVEPDDLGGRSVYFDEYKVDGKIIWGGFSPRSKTVYISLA